MIEVACGPARTGRPTPLTAPSALRRWESSFFVAPGEVLDGRPYTPGTVEVLTRFLASPGHAGLAAAGR
ncbi:hypothetical protein AB0I37_18665 [Micromonospora purpureochromogenes]|uniref:hypothetical protein n=1 Tax=Micromonospora purpureochromogenes TaxID=47872 RepID=UPI0033CEFB2C